MAPDTMAIGRAFHALLYARGPYSCILLDGSPILLSPHA